MATTETATEAVMTSPSFVIVEDVAAFLPKFVLGASVLIIGVLVFIALMVLMSAVLPRLRDVTNHNLRQRPWQSFALGLTGFAIFGALAAFLISNASVEYLLRTEYDPVMLSSGIGICVLLFIMTFLGATGLVKTLGEKLEELNGQDMSGLRRTFWGSLTLVGASLFPGIGWGLVVPAALVFAFGATLRALLPGQ